MLLLNRPEKLILTYIFINSYKVLLTEWQHLSNQSEHLSMHLARPTSFKPQTAMHLQLQKHWKVRVCVFSLSFGKRVVSGEACSCGRGLMFWRFSTSSQAEKPSAVPSLPNQTGARTTGAGVLSLWLVWLSSYGVSPARWCDCNASWFTCVKSGQLCWWQRKFSSFVASHH